MANDAKTEDTVGQISEDHLKGKGISKAAAKSVLDSGKTFFDIAEMADSSSVSKALNVQAADAGKILIVCTQLSRAAENMSAVQHSMSYEAPGAAPRTSVVSFQFPHNPGMIVRKDIQTDLSD